MTKHFAHGKPTMELIFVVRNHETGQLVDRFPSPVDASTYAVLLNRLAGRNVCSVRGTQK